MKVSAAIAAAIALHGCGEGEQKAAAPQEQGFMAKSTEQELKTVARDFETVVGKQLKVLKQYDQKKVEALLKNVIKNKETKKVVKDLNTVIETTISEENRAKLHQELDEITKKYWSTEQLHLAEKEAHNHLDKVVEFAKGISAEQLKVKDAEKELKAMQASIEKHAETYKKQFEDMKFDAVIEKAAAQINAALSSYKIEGKGQVLHNLTKTAKQVAHQAVDASKTIDLSKYEAQVHQLEDQQLKKLQPEQMFNEVKGKTLSGVKEVEKAMLAAEKELNAKAATFDKKIVKKYEQDAVNLVKTTLKQIQG